MTRTFCAFLFLLSFQKIAFSQTQELDSLLNLSAFTAESDLQKIINQRTTVSSKKALSTRETPGIISVISSEEIQNAGARDLTDVLRLVPGFDVQQDLQFVLGIGLRGSWGNEGKVLVMMDGQPFNDLLYQSVAVGNRFPINAIERIEIIRGPGSAIYGGSAEYGVINIITKGAESLNGVTVYGQGGFNSNAVARTNAGFMAAQNGKDVSWDVSFFKGNGIVSNRNYTAMGDSTSVNLTNNSSANPMNINAGLRYKGLSWRTMYDQFRTNDPINFASFKTLYNDIKYQINVSPKLTITPQLKYMHQTPWAYGPVATNEYDFKATAERTLGQLDFNYNASRKINVNAGGIYFNDHASGLIPSTTYPDETSLSLHNIAVYAQALLKHRLANATVGFRYEKNNRYNGAFVPRIALTKKIENFHFKALYSQSFRSPSIQNFHEPLTGSIKPERSSVVELELGYQFTPEMLLSINAFDISTKNTIIFGSQGDGDTYSEWYQNYSKSGSHGLEAVYSIRKKRWYANFSYSYNVANSNNTVTKYQVPQTNKQYVGFPLNKLTLNTSFKITEKLNFNPTFIYASKRYAYTTTDTDGNSIATSLSPYLLANAFLNYNNLFIPGLTLGAGAYDILNQHPAIPQAYNGGYAPVPGRSREWVIKLSYQLDFKK